MPPSRFTLCPLPPALPKGALAVLLLAALTACSAAGTEGAATRAGHYAPPGAPPGTCWSKHTRPAVIETVTSQVMVRPAETDAAGGVLRAALFRTETRQEIVEPRRETWFEIPCALSMTPEFIRTVQRALAARGFYSGPVHGRMDAATRDAVQRYQRPSGLDNGTLSLAAARKLGLVAIGS
ncbi:peptidoglycan-binding domain-containing protein [Cribrihabitans neustonicus]|uniref:peptidoglycan-binding domain-containing protein n=1 Tax=Cribrihabitans neustonicus TaxID=1429085 RepID=UPI003B5A6C7E